MVILLFYEKIKPSFIFFSAVLIFLLTGILTTKDLLNSLANESILNIFLLIFITAGLKEHFNIVGGLDKLFGKSTNPRIFLLRMTSAVAGLSAFLNNTPLVALVMPYLYQWSRKNKVPLSKLMMPLSFAAIIGGMITVIGTSTNLVLNGLIVSKNIPPLGFFDFFYPGIAVTVGGVLFLYLWGYNMLPDRSDAAKSISRQSREYVVETLVPQGSAIEGKSVTDANLRNLTGIYLFEIIRRGRTLTPVMPTEVLEAGDTLFFAGDTGNIVELLARKDELILPSTPVHVSLNGKGLNLVEAVVPQNSELVGATLKEISFRENYDAAVVAIHRNGERLSGKIGEILIMAGDLLLISTGLNFSKRMQGKSSLYLVSTISKTAYTKPQIKVGFAIIVLIAIVGLIAGFINLFLALIIISAYMVAAGLLSITQVKKELDIHLLVILVASLSFSTAIIDTGSAEALASRLIPAFTGFGNMGLITGLYLITLLLTSFVTHVAAVSIMFPIAYALGVSVPGLNMSALFVAIAFAASASFHAPFSYQTNLMVYGPGGYKFKDFLKTGLPFTAIYSVITLLVIYFYYQIS